MGLEERAKLISTEELMHEMSFIHGFHAGTKFLEQIFSSLPVKVYSC